METNQSSVEIEVKEIEKSPSGLRVVWRELKKISWQWHRYCY